MSLQTHVQDVLNHMFFEDVTDVTLVGHSYGGQVVTGVADRAPERIKHLVYLDAFLHRNGETIMQVNEGPGSRPLELEDGWKLSPRRPPQSPDAPPPTPVELWRRARLAPMPIHTWTPASHSRCRWKTARSRAPTSRRRRTSHRRRARATRRSGRRPSSPGSHPAWSYFEVPTSHNVQITMPNELAQILLKLT